MSTPTFEQPKQKEGAATQEGSRFHRLATSLFERVTSSETFQAEKGRIIEALDQGANRVIQKGAEKMARFVTSTTLPEAEARQVAEKAGVNAKLAANEARIRDAFTKVKDHVQRTGADYFTEKAKDRSGETRAERKQEVIDKSQEKRAGLLTRFLSGAADLTPFLGGAKMTIESLGGTTAAGVKMTGKERIIHGMVGVASLALDFTGIGEAGKAIGLVGKSVSFVEKIAARSAAKGSVKTASLFTKTAGFMAKHPTAVAKAEQFAQKKLEKALKDAANYRKGQRAGSFQQAA